MKLFRVDYMDDCDDDTYLTIGNSKEEVEKREKTKLSSELSCFMGCWIFEIDEVDGHKIVVDWIAFNREYINRKVKCDWKK